jgi:S1-C subfamily serine protease
LVFPTDKFKVTFKYGRFFDARKIGVDNLIGLAILKIDSDKYIGPQLGSSKELQNGAWITVIGNSYGIPSTVNFGNFENLTEDGLMRLSINASTGASGGAVLNIDGEIIGVLIARDADFQNDARTSNSAQNVSNSPPYSNNLLSSLGASGGQCYAVFIEMVKEIIDQLIQNDTVNHGYPGVSS